MASIIKVDTIQDQDGNNIISEAANTITIGASGDTITIPSGATLANSGIVTGFQSTGIDDNATSTAITINSSQRVGIGTASPAVKFQVGQTGDSGHLVNIGVDNSNTELQIANRAFYGYYNDGAVIQGAVGKHISFHTNSGTFGANERMRIDSTGKVGIGTSSPSAGLDVVSTNYPYIAEFRQANAGNPGQIVIDSPSDNGARPSLLNFETGGVLKWSTGLGYNDTNRSFHISTSSLGSGTTGSKFTITPSGNVGIGTSSPEGKFQSGNPPTSTGAVGTQAGFFVGAKSQFAGATALYQNQVCILDTNNTPSAGAGGALTFAGYQSTTSTTFFATIEGVKENSTVNDYGGSLKFYTRTNGVANMGEHMRIDSSGRFLVGNSSTIDNHKAFIKNVTTSNILAIQSTGSDYANMITFYNAGSVVKGSIGATPTSVSYNTSSDYRLKENVNYNFDATTRLKQLKPARFNFIVDADTTVDGFLAHEVQDIVPEAISGIKDATETKEKVVVNANGNVIAENIEQADWEAGKIADEEGKSQYPTDSTWEATKVVPVYQGIDQAKLVPLLVKTIQELEARITALENNQP